MQLDLKSSYINVNGVQHYYEWIKTPSQDQKKPVMVFLHGWGGSGRYWTSTAQALSDQFDCLIYDLRGFGRSKARAIEESSFPVLSYELVDYAHELKGVLDALNLEKVYLNAHSMGGSIAALFLNLYPERVERAVFTCSGIFEYDEKTFTTFHKFSRYVVLFRPKWLAKIPLADKVFMARFLHRSLPTSVSKAFLEDFLLADFDAAYGTVLTSVSKEATEWLPQQFSQFTVPTLLVAGEYDQIIPAEMGRQAAALNDKIELAILENTAHFPMLEDAPTYLERVREFINNH
ncbi:phospholipase/Carboxylesterase family protein [Lyngbya aestuarii BL J]|uniref:Phospholipase/Carboxylesterase family protein n=1 Tax=Lyngbya aestuarii BL J TaxID=1348334 RepID=U7QRM3_9CYAN|nr:alpha/beta hydrolase [Lyngbya aestuarii]ERT09775.1 phospholipase/Carboxylesterase family protein [Lyngbya aestuarii BL J]